MFAQAMIEKGALDGMSTGLTQFRYRMTEFAQDERALFVIAVAFVLVLVWRMRR
jgi:hypothetical protein